MRWCVPVVLWDGVCWWCCEMVCAGGFVRWWVLMDLCGGVVWLRGVLAWCAGVGWHGRVVCWCIEVVWCGVVRWHTLWDSASGEGSDLLTVMKFNDCVRIAVFTLYFTWHENNCHVWIIVPQQKVNKKCFSEHVWPLVVFVVSRAPDTVLCGTVDEIPQI